MQVADSGDDLEDQVYKEAMMLKAKGWHTLEHACNGSSVMGSKCKMHSSTAPFCFNCDNNENDPGRSDNKGCEPEAIE
eukprot:6122-Pelagomonas_calceolata.AAC.1